jgi:hypothetical protein
MRNSKQLTLGFIKNREYIPLNTELLQLCNRILLILASIYLLPTIVRFFL